MYCEEVPLSCKYFTKIRKRKALPEPHLCFWTCRRAGWSLCSLTEKCWVVTPVWSLPVPGERNLVLRSAELSPSMWATDRSGRAAFGTRRAFLSPFLLNCSHWLWCTCTVPYPGHSSVLGSPWGSDSADDGCAHYSSLTRTFFSPQGEKSWGGISAPTAALQRPEEHS